MPACAICSSSFCYTSFSGPAEPCDCGACVLVGSVNDWSRIKALRDRFKAGEDITNDKGEIVEPVEAE